MQLCEQQILHRLSMEHENLIEMLDYSYCIHNEENCQFLFEGYYEYPDSDLENEIKLRSRSKENKSFTDLEIFNMIKEITNALFFFQKNKLIHGDIR